MNLQEPLRQLAQNRLDHEAELNALAGKLESIKVILWVLARTQQQPTTLRIEWLGTQERALTVLSS
ncbi:hypothetical protein [Luteimonas salinisoli]|nr:hypothetical protein [Luteimonas salinisoli]